MENEQTWKTQLESTTDEQWDQMAHQVRNEINTGDITLNLGEKLRKARINYE